MEELKPCPCCGSLAIIIRYKHLFWIIGCVICPLKMEAGWSKNKIIKAWNTRAKEGSKFEK